MANIDTLGIEYIRTERDNQGSPILDLYNKGQTYPFLLQTFHFGTVRSGPARTVTAHHHGVYHIVLYGEGENLFSFRKGKYRSFPGCLVLTAPEEPHDFTPLARGTVVYHELTFTLDGGRQDNPGDFTDLLELYTGRPLDHAATPCSLSPRQAGWANLIFESLKNELKKEGNRDWFRIKRMILELLGFLADEVYQSESKDTELEKTIPHGASLTRDYLDRRFRESTTIPLLAEKAGVTPEHLCRIFKEHYGLPPMAYRRKLQIEAARNLLSHSSLSCKEIAHGLGFADAYSFSRAYKKETGRSPTSFRKDQSEN